MENQKKQVVLTCRDGLSLFCRYFHHPSSEKTPVLCLPGLTRNSKDFVDLARRHGDTRSFICPDLRGRGMSDRDTEWARYHPGTYVEDMWELLDFLEIGRVTIIGTSLGGLMAMIMANVRPEAVAGIILNDVGPEVNPKGISRVMEYVGLLPGVADWDEAVAQVREVYGAALPGLDEKAWMAYTKCQYREDGNGVPRIEYDPNIGDALRHMGGVPADLWILFRNLKEGLPVLALRGALSDILSREAFDKMAAARPDLARVTVSNRGHVPILDEPECASAIDDFLAKGA